MKKLLLALSIVCVIPYSKAAYNEAWENAVHSYQPIDQQKILNLSLKKITQIPPLNLPKLQKLILSNNQITNILDLNLPNLQILYLNGNRLQKIPGLNLPQLEYLWLNHNQIEQFDAENLLKQFPNLVFLDISDNPQLNPKYIENLRKAAKEARRKNITITAKNIKEPE